MAATSLVDSGGAGIESLEIGLQGCPLNGDVRLAIDWLHGHVPASVLHTEPVWTSGTLQKTSTPEPVAWPGCVVLSARLGRIPRGSAVASR